MEEQQDNLEQSIIAPSLKEKITSSYRDVTPQADLTKKQEQEKVSIMSWKAPLPPPEAVEKYENILPGSAHRLITLVENEAHSRHENYRELIKNEKQVIKNTFTTEISGQIFGFIVVMTAIISGVVISVYGNPAWGGVISLTGLATLGGAFIINRFPFNKSTKKKNKEIKNKP